MDIVRTWAAPRLFTMQGNEDFKFVRVGRAAAGMGVVHKRMYPIASILSGESRKRLSTIRLPFEPDILRKRFAEPPAESRIRFAKNQVISRIPKQDTQTSNH